jgi:hypothetical protein
LNLPSHQVLALLPQKSAHGQQTAAWAAVAANLSKSPLFAAGVSGKMTTIKYNALLTSYRQEERSKIASTGTDNEVVDEIFQLLEDLKQLEDDDKEHKKEEKRSKCEGEAALVTDGEKIRAKAMGQLKSEKHKSSATTHITSAAESVGQFLQAKTEQRQQELELQKRRLDLEEKQFLLQADAQQKRAKLEELDMMQRLEIVKLLANMHK